MNRRPVIVGVVIALLGAAGYAGYQYFFTAGSGAVQFTAMCGYDECGWTGDARASLGSPYPLQCPRCGKNSVLHVATCKGCGNKQILNELLSQFVPGKEKLKPPTMCKKCNGAIRHGD